MGGNPCAVVFDAGDLALAARLAFTRETRLSECAFLQPSDQADFGVRYCVASAEIKMAGHPTIATCVALERAGWLEGRDRFTLEVGAGVLAIEIARGQGPTRFTMTQFAPQFGQSYEPGEIAALVGLEAADILGTPQTVSTGTAFCIVRLRDGDALARARLDPGALEAFRPRADFFEPFLCVTQGFTPQGDTSARLLLTPPEPPEDPFTGSATGCMAALLYRDGLVGASFVAEQGHLMDRPGRAWVEVLGTRDTITGVKVTGTGVVLMHGTLEIPQ